MTEVPCAMMQAGYPGNYLPQNARVFVLAPFVAARILGVGTKGEISDCDSGG